MQDRAVSRALEQLSMIRFGIVVICVFASYFALTWLFLGYWGQALMTGILATIVFSTTLLAVGVVVRDQPWLAFWITNAVLILVFGGIELYGLLTIKDNPATRFDGARLSVDGHITIAGYASLAFDVTICTLGNFLGVGLSRILIRRFGIE